MGGIPRRGRRPPRLLVFRSFLILSFLYPSHKAENEKSSDTTQNTRFRAGAGAGADAEARETTFFLKPFKFNKCLTR